MVREKQRRKKERALEAVMQIGEEKGSKRLGDEDSMDVDDDGKGRVTRNSKRPGGFGFGGGVGRRLG